MPRQGGGGIGPPSGFLRAGAESSAARKRRNDQKVRRSVRQHPSSPGNGIASAASDQASGLGARNVRAVSALRISMPGRFGDTCSPPEVLHSTESVERYEEEVMPASTFHRVLSASAIALLLLSAPAFAQPSDIDRIVTFGASLSDSGNAFRWLSENPACGTPLSVPPYDDLVPNGPYARGGHHFSNGATWVEQLTRDLALNENAQPAFRSADMKATNYAVGGARAIAGYPCRFNLPDQVGVYLTDFPHTSPLTLVAIEIGGNDVRDGLVAALVYHQDPTPYITNAIASVAASIGLLYSEGAQRFLVLNVPDVGKTPAVRMLGPEAAAFADSLSQYYNALLAGAVMNLTKTLPGIDLKILDVYGILNNVVASPEAYGFLNATDACITPGVAPFTCAKPDTYAFWDGIHPTQALHAIVAEQALALISPQ